MGSTDGPVANTIRGWRELATVEPDHCWTHSVTVAEQLKSTHGAYIAVATCRARPHDGALAGVPFAVKDNIDTTCLPTSGGSHLLAGSMPIADAVVVRRLTERGQLAVPVGVRRWPCPWVPRRSRWAPIPADR